MFKEHVGTIRYLDPYPRFNPDICIDVEKENDGTEKVTLNTPKGPLCQETKIVPGTEQEVLKVTSKHYIQELEDIDRYLSISYEPSDIGITKVREIERTIGNRGLVQVTFFDPLGAVYLQIEPEKFLTWSILEKEKLKSFTQIIYKRIKNEISSFLEAGVGDVFYFNGPEFILPPSQSPEFFDEFVTFYDTKLFDLIHSYGKLVIVHSHGKINNFLKKFADMGVDALHPIEPLPSGDVDIADAKRQYGTDICFIGNIQYQELVDCKTDEIEVRVKKLINDASAGGGLVVSPCSGLYEVPLSKKVAQNYIAMIDAVRKYGVY